MPGLSVTERFEILGQGQFSPADAVRVMEAVEGGDMDEAQLANWFRKRMD